MDDVRVLMDSFTLYYEKGMQALTEERLESAQRNILAAAEALLLVAKKSSGDLKVQRIKRSEELVKLSEQISDKIQFKNANTQQSAVNVDRKRVEQRSQQNNSEKDNTSTQFVQAKPTGVSLADVAGLDNAKREIIDRVVNPQKYPEIFKQFNKKSGGGILLYGLPGTGKTMFAQAIATELNAAFFPVKTSDIGSKWFGESEQNIRNLFEEARKHPVSVIFFDEFEALGSKRDTVSTVMKRLVPELLSQIQGFEKYDNTLLIIAATNRPWDIDSAFLRPGRFNTQIYIPLPDDAARLAIIKNQFKGTPVSDDLDWNKMVDLTDGFNGADVVEFCDRMKDNAIKDSIELGSARMINNNDIAFAESIVHSSVNLEDLRKIFSYEDKK